MSIKDITIVITSFKSEKKIKKCLSSIDRQCYVINVENSDNQEHKRNVEKEFKNVRCILAGENLGYAKANNVGLREVKTKYALILNPDAELFPKTLENFLTVAQQNPDFAIIGPNIKENKGQENDSAILDVRVTTSVKGFAMFLNLSEFKEFGFFDENFFIYLEEISFGKTIISEMMNPLYFLL